MERWIAVSAKQTKRERERGENEEGGGEIVRAKGKGARPKEESKQKPKQEATLLQEGEQKESRGQVRRRPLMEWPRRGHRRATVHAGRARYRPASREGRNGTAR